MEFHSISHFSCTLCHSIESQFPARPGNPDVTGIPQVKYSTSQLQLTSKPAEVAYHTKPPITTKPVVRTN